MEREDVKGSGTPILAGRAGNCPACWTGRRRDFRTAQVETPDPAVNVLANGLYEHCKRAILRGLGTGEHGLPLIGSGDEAFADRCRAEAEGARLKIEEHGWDGEWSRRSTNRP